MKMYNKFDSREGKKDVFSIWKARAAGAEDSTHIRVIKNESGLLLLSNDEICQEREWREHFEIIFNIEFHHPPLPPFFTVEGPVLLIT